MLRPSDAEQVDLVPEVEDILRVLTQTASHATTRPGPSRDSLQANEDMYLSQLNLEEKRVIARLVCWWSSCLEL